MIDQLGRSRKSQLFGIDHHRYQSSRICWGNSGRRPGTSHASIVCSRLHRAPDEVLFSSVMSLSRAIRAKQVSSEEVVRAYLDRIAAVNPKINAVVTLCAPTSR